jgi:hypothetical protein
MTLISPAWLALALPLGAVTLWAWHTGHANLTTRRRVLALALRLLIVSAIVLGLAGLSLSRPVSRQATVCVGE